MHILQREGWRAHPCSWRERNRTSVSSSRAVPVPAHPPPEEHKQQQQLVPVPSATNRAVTLPPAVLHICHLPSAPPISVPGEQLYPPTNAATLGWADGQQPFAHPPCTLQQHCTQQQRARVSHARDWLLC